MCPFHFHRLEALRNLDAQRDSVSNPVLPSQRSAFTDYTTPCAKLTRCQIFIPQNLFLSSSVPSILCPLPRAHLLQKKGNYPFLRLFFQLLAGPIRKSQRCFPKSSQVQRSNQKGRKSWYVSWVYFSKGTLPTVGPSLFRSLNSYAQLPTGSRTIDPALLSCSQMLGPQLLRVASGNAQQAPPNPSPLI